MHEQIMRVLEQENPQARIALKYSNPVQLLVAVMLSAQCTDKQVNNVTEHLFKKYKSPEDFAKTGLKELQKDIRSTGFFRVKAKNLRNACRIIAESYGGKVPDRLDELIKLPGVGRKTANVVLSNAYARNEGIAVDTHVKRLSFRLGFTKESNPDKIEKDLMALFPRDKWNKVTYLLIEHGRTICKAPVPLCSKCPLNKTCPKNGVTKYK